ncbi:MAG: helix-turn-helix domain-containing protein [Oscillospiraceae bacterium]
MEQKQIGSFIQANRKAKGLTQQQLAEIMGVSDKSISRWENGKTMADISLLPLLAQTLDVTIDELLKGERNKPTEIIDSDKTIESLIDYQGQSEKQKSEKVNKYIYIGNLLIIIAILNNHFDFFRFIFTDNMAEFVSGALYGCGIMFDLMGLYYNNANISLREKKKSIVKRLKKDN